LLLQRNFWLQQQKKIFIVPNFVAVAKPFFSVLGFCGLLDPKQTKLKAFLAEKG